MKADELTQGSRQVQEKALVLLDRIVASIGHAFPDAHVMVEPHRCNNSSVFHIGRVDGWRSVEVTETFLDADDGLDGALSRLTGLGVQLTRLRPGQALLVTNDGLRVELAA